MRSDEEIPRRLHPASVLFNLASLLRAVALPLVFVIFGARSSDAIAQVLGVIFIIPVGLATAARYFTFTYTYGPSELIIRSGLFVRRERHIPYDRIQNIDASQNIVHAIFRVYTVTLETGGGEEAEAALKVLPEDALAEMRTRVFARRAAPAAATPEASAADAESPDVLLHLSLGDLARCGLVRGRGLLLLGAILSAAAELGLDDAAFETAEDPQSRGPIAGAIRSAVKGAAFDWTQVLAVAVVFVLLVFVLRVFSMIYTMQKLYGFSLTHRGGELRMTYGLLTRVRATIPIRRIQALTIREGPLHRLFRVSSVRADTAGGEADQQVARSREWLAPIIDRAALPSFVERLLPGAAVAGAGWQPAHPRAARRQFLRGLPWPLVASGALIWYAGLEGWILLVAATAFTWWRARMQVRHMGHCLAGGFFMYRSGWIWRHVTIAPLAKVQAVSMAETPFDRRHGMAGLLVDTAGAGGAAHRLDVPYLDRARAGTLAAAIAAGASESALTW